MTQIQVRIEAATTPRQIRYAGRLISEYLQWGMAAAGIDDLARTQPSSVAELGDLGTYYRAPLGVLLLGWIDADKPVGVCGVKVVGPRLAELKRLYVRPAARRHGVARQLLTSAIRYARSVGSHTVRLEAHRTLTRPAIDLYRGIGFVERDPFDSIQLEGIVAFELDLTKELSV